MGAGHDDTFRAAVGGPRWRLPHNSERATKCGGAGRCDQPAVLLNGLRDYGTATWEGGNVNCDHLGRSQTSGASTLGEWKDGGGQLYKEETGGIPFKHVCGKCGAIRIDQQIGLEKTPQEFVAKLVEVFREVRRVLRGDGVMFCNIGDSYNAHPGQRTEHDKAGTKQATNRGSCEIASRSTPGLKPKDLCMMPWRLFLALQDDGWWCRDIIAWAKKSPMPESVTDRCTKSWEPIGMFTKSANYFWDAEAVKEAVAACSVSRLSQNVADQEGSHRANGGEKSNGTMKAVGDTSGRNLRNVWTLGSDPFPEAHFATFPRAIPERCIKAASSERGACAACGAPYRRITDKTQLKRERPNDYVKRNGTTGTGAFIPQTSAGVAVTTRGWEKACRCETDDVRPCIVLDPFSGSGTSGMVATELGREYIGIELSETYAEMSRKRIESWKTRDAEKQPEAVPGQRTLFGD